MARPEVIFELIFEGWDFELVSEITESDAFDLKYSTSLLSASISWSRLAFFSIRNPFSSSTCLSYSSTAST